MHLALPDSIHQQLQDGRSNLLMTTLTGRMLVSPQIVDGPRFTWRGALLDVGRHYFSVPFILKFLDSLALHKINKFHWHLTEDQVSLSDAWSAHSLTLHLRLSPADMWYNPIHVI